MCANIENHIKENKPFNMFRAFRCNAIDAIFSICFARSLNMLSAPDFLVPLERAMYTQLPVTMLFKHFPIIKALVSKFPPKVLGYLQPEMKGFFDMLEVCLYFCISLWPVLIRKHCAVACTSSA